jgi:tetratricopeptide (TPR) repeat protein
VFAASAGAITTILSTIYEDVAPGPRTALLIAVGLFAAAAVLLTESTPGMPMELAVPPGPGTNRASGRSEDTGRASGRVGSPPRSATRGHRPRPGAQALPPGDGLFLGREQELAELMEWHDMQRRERDLNQPGRRGRRSAHPIGRQAAGPVLLLIHGKPGVGKSAVTGELAHRLADQYPDGQIVVNLGTAGGARPPIDVLRDFLVALGERELPETTVDRAKLFRTLVKEKRILLVLDAARDADQVRQLLPSDPEAAVIVTGRPDLSVDPELSTWSHLSERSYLLDVPDEDEALELFRALSGTDDATRPECAVEIVHMCGRLPAAIRSAAERVRRDGTDICHVAGLLRRSGSRLAGLERPGRPVSTLIEAEYDRLLPAERLAFALLSLVPAPTFVPWVLTALMKVDKAEAEALTDRLAMAQLLDNRGPDDPSGLARYGFHPLTRLFARGQAEKLTEAECERAAARLAETFRGLAAAVVAHREGRRDEPQGHEWLPPGSPLASRISAQLDRWVRADYLNLLPVLELAYENKELRLCWRIGTWLGGCVPSDVDRRAVERAYGQAIDAAVAEGARLGRVDVLLAKGTFLAAVERHRAAEECLRDAAAAARDLQRDSDAGSVPQDAACREAAASRKIGEAYLQNSSYRFAVEALNEAAELAATSSCDDAERQLIQLLIAEVHHVESPEATYDQVLNLRLPDANRYRVFLALADAARWRGDRHSAYDHLEEALHFVSGDLHRMAAVQYRMACLHLDRGLRHARDDANGSGARDGDRDEPIPPDAVRAIRCAARAAITLAQMGNLAGALRAHCLLARALLAAGRPVEAQQVGHAAERDLNALDGVPENMRAPLAAQVNRTRGELLLYAGEAQEAGRLLVEAATTFGEHEDWDAQRETMDLLNHRHRPRSQPAPAWGRDRASGAGTPVSSVPDGVPGQRRREQPAGEGAGDRG